MGLSSRPASQGKAGSLGPDSSSAATLFCASVSPLVKRLPFPWVEEDPTINTVLPRPHWVALCLLQGARAVRSGLYEKWAPSPLFQKGRHSHLVCDEPRSKWPRARVGQDKTVSPRAPPARPDKLHRTSKPLPVLYTLPGRLPLHATLSFLSLKLFLKLMPTSGLSLYTPSSRKPSLAPQSGSNAPLLYSKGTGHLLLRLPVHLFVSST